MARRILDAAGAYLRDQLAIRRWLDATKTRRPEYLDWCGVSVHRLKQMTGGEEPSDDAVLSAIEGMLKADKTLEAHVAREDADFFTDPENWAHVYRATAGLIYHEYLKDLERGSPA